jgi:hypothetical protein
VAYSHRNYCEYDNRHDHNNESRGEFSPILGRDAGFFANRLRVRCFLFSRLNDELLKQLGLAFGFVANFAYAGNSHAAGDKEY